MRQGAGVTEFVFVVGRRPRPTRGSNRWTNGPRWRRTKSVAGLYFGNAATLGVSADQCGDRYLKPVDILRQGLRGA